MPTLNAFQILMSSNMQRILPAHIAGDNLRGDQRLCNSVIDVLEKDKIGWSPQMVSSAGFSCVSQITSALWYFDTHHDTLHERSLHLPVKPCCIYSKAKLGLSEERIISDIKSSNLYTCGSFLFPPSSEFSETIIVRQDIECLDLVESQYFTASLVHFSLLLLVSKP